MFVFFLNLGTHLLFSNVEELVICLECESIFRYYAERSNIFSVKENLKQVISNKERL